MFCAVYACEEGLQEMYACEEGLQEISLLKVELLFRSK